MLRLHFLSITNMNKHDKCENHIRKINLDFFFRNKKEKLDSQRKEQAHENQK